jgi:polyisoprenoid-binding protein YceI
MRNRLLFCMFLTVLCLAAPPAQAADPAPVVDGATLDPPHTSTTFWIRHIVAPVAGRFNETAGTIDIPAQTPGKGHIAFTVKTQSVDTGVAARDTHLRTAEFLDTAAFPQMTFKSERIIPAGKGIYKVTGKLTIKDVTRTVSIPVKYLGTKPHPMMPCVDAIGYEAELSLNRLAYHVGTGKYFKMGLVGDAVDIHLAGETLAARPGCVKPAAGATAGK